MLRSLILISILLSAAPSIGATLLAGPLTRLDQPSQTVTLDQGGVRMIAFYDRKDDILDLNLLITDAEGETLRTRIGLKNRQHHTMILQSTSDLEGSTRIEFLRTGDRIEMVLGTDPVVTDLASRSLSLNSFEATKQ